MNLALKDLRRQKARFTATAIGLGLLFAVVLAMTGIYRGLVMEATLLVDRMDADLWIVQRDTRGPFAERSTVPPEWEDRMMAVDGVASARAFSTASIQRTRAEKTFRMNVVGLAWPQDRGNGLPLIAGRALSQAHREIIVDQTLGLKMGEALPLGDESYTVVGVTKGMTSSGGDGLLFASELDARAIIAWMAPEARRLEREARIARLQRTGDAAGHASGQGFLFFRDRVGAVDHQTSHAPGAGRLGHRERERDQQCFSRIRQR